MSWLRLSLAALILVAAGGCGSSNNGDPPAADNEPDSATSQDAGGSGSDADPTESADSASDGESDGESPDYPCDLLSEQALTATLGQSPGSGRSATGQTSENDVMWTSDTCRWGDDDSLELKLSVSAADAFPDGALLCPEPLGIAGDVSPVSDVGTQAWWVWVEIATVEGMLRVCTDTALIDIGLEAPSGESAAFQAQATDIATEVLAQL